MYSVGSCILVHTQHILVVHLYTCTHTPLVHNFSSHTPLEYTHPVLLYSCILTDPRYYPIIVHYCGCKHSLFHGSTRRVSNLYVGLMVEEVHLYSRIHTHLVHTLPLYTPSLLPCTHPSSCTHHPYFLIHTSPCTSLLNLPCTLPINFLSSHPPYSHTHHTTLLTHPFTLWYSEYPISEFL